jgi:ferritin-like metal-binding protein YciE
MAATKTKTAVTPPKSQAAADLMELFEDELKDIYWAEKALTRALPKMAKNATSKELKTALTDHLEVTTTHVQRAEQIFALLGKKAQAKKCEAMDGLLKEGDEIVESTKPGPVRDAGIISACQKVEHYEIATYGTLAAFATLLGQDKAAKLLQATLAEEKKADTTLTTVAETAINIEAMEAGDNSKEETKKNTANKSSKKATPQRKK